MFLTMPIDPASDSIAQQVEYLWHIKAVITRHVIVGVIVALLEDPLDHLERLVPFYRLYVFSSLTNI